MSLTHRPPHTARHHDTPRLRGPWDRQWLDLVQHHGEPTSRYAALIRQLTQLGAPEATAIALAMINA